MGVKVTRTQGGLFLSKDNYANDIIVRAGYNGMSSCKPYHTPVDTSNKLDTSFRAPVTDPTLCRSLVGALQYLTFTRLDISYVVQGTLTLGLYLHATPSSTLM